MAVVGSFIVLVTLISSIYYRCERGKIIIFFIDFAEVKFVEKTGQFRSTEARRHTISHKYYLLLFDLKNKKLNLTINFILLKMFKNRTPFQTFCLIAKP